MYVGEPAKPLRGPFIKDSYEQKLYVIVMLV